MQSSVREFTDFFSDSVLKFIRGTPLFLLRILSDCEIMCMEKDKNNK